MFTGGAHEQQERSKAWAEGQAPPPSRRIAAIDIFRGLAIFEVVTHHVTGMALRATVPGSDLHLLVGVLNRVLHFAVPGFLFMTAVVLTRAALKRFDVKKYYVGRAKRSLLPYVLWTAIFAVFKVLTGANPPEVLLDPERWLFWLQYGKAYFHLYFLLIALQFYLVLPLLLPLWRRKWPAWAVVLAAAALQVAVLYLNRAYFQFRFPGTMALWYIAPITLGMYFGATYAGFEDFWKRNRPYIIAVAVAGGLWYVPQAYQAISGARVNSTSYMLSAWLYTSSMALLLFGIAHSLTRVSQNIQRPIARLGTVSLQIYLLHPALLFFLDRAGFPGNPPLYLLTILGYTLLGLLLPFIVARLLEGTRASLWLFGR